MYHWRIMWWCPESLLRWHGQLGENVQQTGRAVQFVRILPDPVIFIQSVVPSKTAYFVPRLGNKLVELRMEGATRFHRRCINSNRFIFVNVQFVCNELFAAYCMRDVPLSLQNRTSSIDEILVNPGISCCYAYVLTMRSVLRLRMQSRHYVMSENWAHRKCNCRDTWRSND